MTSSNDVVITGRASRAICLVGKLLCWTGAALLYPGVLVVNVGLLFDEWAERRQRYADAMGRGR